MKIYDTKTKAYLWLSNTKGVSPDRARRIVASCDIEDMYNEPLRFKSYIVDKFGGSIYENLVFSHDEKLIVDMLDELATKHIQLLTLGDKDYPQLLKEIPEPPVLLYMRGDRSLLATDMIGVVGSRELTRYGKDVTGTFVEGLVLAGFTIVSGMARGVDSEAHTMALQERGKTIAVLGCGIDIVYPPENLNLYNEIVEKGLVISEYPLGTKPNAYQFPERNRLIAGLSRGILVTEAGEKSGSLITADMAIEYGRGLYLVPSNINSRYGKGTNSLIKRMQGAMVLDVNDILEDMNVSGVTIAEPCGMQLDFTEEIIADTLSKGDKHFDELKDLTGLSVAALSALLSKMELFGIIKKLSNNTYGV